MLHLLTRRCAFAARRLTTLHADALTALEKPSSRPKVPRSGAEMERPLSSPLSPPSPSPQRGASANPPFDLVTTHFFLDCFSAADLARLIPAIRARLMPGALWVVSDFRVPPSGPLRLPARVLVRLLYFAFRLFAGLRPTRLPDFASLLRQSGLAPVRIHHSLAGLLTAELWQLPPVSHPPDC